MNSVSRGDRTIPNTSMTGPSRCGTDDRSSTTNGVPRMRRAAGTLSMFLCMGFGIPCAFGIRHLAQTGQVWTFLG